MSSNGVCCSNNGCPSWQTADNASLGQADALLFHSFQQSLVLVSHLIKFIYSTNSWKQLKQDKDLSDNTLTEGQVCATIECYIRSPTQNPRDCRRHRPKSPFQPSLFSFHGNAAKPARIGHAASLIIHEDDKTSFLKIDNKSQKRVLFQNQ